MMSQHGDSDPQQQKWFCSYWMTQEEWLDIHDYSPPMLESEERQVDEGDEE
jgi:hypothetical protein